MKKIGVLCLIFFFLSWEVQAGFDDLPDECVLCILSKLRKLKDIIHFGETSKRHRALSQDNFLWSRFLNGGIRLSANDLKHHQENKGEIFSYRNFIFYHHKDSDYYFKTHPNPILFVIENQLGGSKTKRFKTSIAYGKSFLVDDGCGRYAPAHYRAMILLDASNVTRGRFHYIRKNQVSSEEEICFISTLDWYYDKEHYVWPSKHYFLDDKGQKQENKKAKILILSKIKLIKEKSKWYFFNSAEEEYSGSRPMNSEEKHEYKDRTRDWKSFSPCDSVYEEPQFSLVIIPNYLRK